MLEVRVLGPVTLEADGQPRSVGGKKQLRLLAILAARAGRESSPDELIEALWDGEPPATAAGTLQTYLSHLRRALEPDRPPGAPSTVLVSTTHGYRLELPEGALDATTFEAHVTGVRRDLTPDSAAEASTRLSAALALWRGRAFGDFADDDFARGRSVQLEELRLAALETRIEADLLSGRSEELVPELEALVDEHPLREVLWGHLMVALYRSGRQSDALQAYQRVQGVLLDELGLEPGPELQELELAILRQDPELLPPGRVEPRPATGRPVPPIPRPLTAFVGRAVECDRVRNSLEANRLTTITGPGGFGKTRLALRIAADESERGRPVLFADVEAAERAEAVGGVVAAALGAGASPAGMRGGALLVVDNAEIFGDAAATAVRDALVAAPDVTVLVTSRTPLGIPGEVLVPLGPLQTPEPGQPGAVADVDSVELFADRMGRDRTTFDARELESVVALCRAADGIPLGIELLAARLGVMTMQEVVDRIGSFLDDVTDEPGSTLAALIDWSFDSLDPDDRDVCDLASAFSGSFTLDMLEAIVADGNGARLPESVTALFERALITSGSVAGRSRYSMTPLLRRRVWARVRSGPSGESVSRRHAELFAGRADLIDAAFGSPDWLAHIESLDTDHALDHDQGNFRRALGWAIDHDEAELAFRLTRGLTRYWRWRGRWSECEEWLDRALAIPEMAEHGGAKARLLRERASLARQTGAWQEALAYAEEAAATFEDAGDMSGLADATYDLGWGALLGGRFDEAEEAFDRAIELQRGAGTPELASFPMVTKAWVRRMRGDLAGAEALWEEAEEANELVTRTGVEFWRADLLVDKGDFDAAEVVALRSLECATELGFDAHRTGARYVLSRVAAARGDHRTAEILSEAAIAGAGRSGAPEIEGLARRLRAGLALQPGSGLDAAAEIDALAPFARSLGGELGPIVMGELRAGVLVDDDASAARAALGAAARFRSEFGLPLTGPEARWVATWAAAAADVVPDRDWDLGDLASFAFG